MAMLRVLIADDDDDMREHMVALLSRSYQVVGAVTNTNLFQAATRTRPDVIVCDVSSRRLEGLAARKKLIAEGKIIPFVFVSRSNSEDVINMLWKERSFAFIFREEVSMHLVNAVEAVYNLAIYDSPFYPNLFDEDLENQKVVVIQEETLRKAERMVLSCEMCNSEAEIPFSEILDHLTGSDPAVTDYILEKPCVCPRCFRAITERSFIEPKHP